jgi:XTP/dITP diphosphohydrolase
MTTLYIASTNAGKLRDFATAAAAHQLRIESLPGLASIPPAPEDEPTFEGNARSKAIYYSQRAPGLVVLADDSGLEVGALHGAPGVRSARYAADGPAAAGLPAPDLSIDQRNNLRLLAEMRSVPEAQRTGRYRCVLAAAQDGRVLFTAQGFVDGRILTAPRGSGGFGYDPLFLIPERNQTMSEIDLQTRHSLSHRGMAFRKFLEIWESRQPSRIR